MKLHLPKLLFVAVVAAASHFNTTNAAEVTNLGSGKYDVGTGTSGELKTFTNTKVGEAGIVVGKDMQVGAFDSNGNLITNFSTYKLDPQKVTNSLEIKKTKKILWSSEAITGDLTIESNGKVAVGGQIDEATYAGIHADNVVVKDSGQLYATRALFSSLTVQDSANVQLHGGFTSGNGYLGVNAWTGTGMGGTPKMVQITKALTIHGGNLSIGTTQASQSQYILGLGADNSILGTTTTSITQTNGSMSVYGNTIAQAGLSITQSGGSMIFRDKLALNGSGTSTITQETSGDLLIGRLSGESSNTVNISQTGSGSITLAYGANFDSNGTVNVSQSSTGNIYLGGGHTVDIGNDYSEEGYATKYNKTFNGFSTNNATFNLTQTGVGTIHVKDTFAVNNITQNQKGSLTVYAGKTLTANTVNAGVITSDKGSVQLNGNVTLTDGTLKTDGSTVTNTGTLTANTVNVNTGSLKMDDNGSLSAGSINANNGNVSINTNVSLSNGAISIDGDTVTNTGNLSAGQIVVNGGTFINEGNINYTVPSAQLALGSDEDNALLLLSGTTDTSDVVVKGGDFVNIGNVGNVVVEKDGTLTMKDLSSASSIVMDGGRINVTGESTVGSLTLNGENNVINFDFSNGETAPSIVQNSGEALDLSSTTIMVTVSTEMLENLAGQDFELFGGNVENITNATFVFTDGDDDTTNDKTADVVLGSTSGSIKVEIQAVPEPTTATLSLLALVGLAARRRRK